MGGGGGCCCAAAQRKHAGRGGALVSHCTGLNPFTHAEWSSALPAPERKHGIKKRGQDFVDASLPHWTLFEQSHSIIRMCSLLLKSLCLSSKAPQEGIDGRTRRPGLSYCHIDFEKEKKLFIAPRSSKRRAICTPRVGISRMYAFRAHISKEHKTERHDHRVVSCDWGGEGNG